MYCYQIFFSKNKRYEHGGNHNQFIGKLQYMKTWRSTLYINLFLDITKTQTKMFFT